MSQHINRIKSSDRYPSYLWTPNWSTKLNQSGQHNQSGLLGKRRHSTDDGREDDAEFSEHDDAEFERKEGLSQQCDSHDLLNKFIQRTKLENYKELPAPMGQEFTMTPELKLCFKILVQGLVKEHRALYINKFTLEKFLRVYFQINLVRHLPKTVKIGHLMRQSWDWHNIPSYCPCAKNSLIQKSGQKDKSIVDLTSDGNKSVADNDKIKMSLHLKVSHQEVQLQKSGTQSEQLAAEREEMKKMAKKQEGRLKKYRDNLDAANALTKQLAAEQEKIDKKLRAAEKECSNQKRKNTTIQKKVNKQEGQLKECQDKLNATNSAKEQLETEKKEIENTVKEYKDTQDELIEKLDEANAANLKMEDEVTEHRRDAESLKSINHGLISRLRETKEQLQNVQRSQQETEESPDLETARIECADLKKANAEIQEKLEAARKECSDLGKANAGIQGKDQDTQCDTPQELIILNMILKDQEIVNKITQERPELINQLFAMLIRK